MLINHANVTLVLGGVSSGKSAYAESLFDGIKDKHYIATAQPSDKEMAAKIENHKERRGPDWVTHESPLSCADIIESLPNSPILFDCATIWLSNHLLSDSNHLLSASDDILSVSNIDAEVENLCRAISEHKAYFVIVSNDVGNAPVPSTKLGRQFQRAQGELNQRLVELAFKVDYVTAGIVQKLK